MVGSSLRVLMWKAVYDVLLNEKSKSTEQYLKYKPNKETSYIRLCVWKSIGNRSARTVLVMVTPGENSRTEGKGCVFICKGCCNKIPQPGWLNQQKLTFSQFWRLEVKVLTGFFWGLSPWLVHSHLLAASSRGFFRRDTSLIGLGPTLTASFNLITF